MFDADEKEFGEISFHGRPIPHMSVARTENYTYAAKVWALPIVRGYSLVTPCQTTIDTHSTHDTSPLGV